MFVALDDVDTTEITESQSSLYDHILMDTLKSTGNPKVPYMRRTQCQFIQKKILISKL